MAGVRAFLSLGSNLGDRLDNLVRAAREIERAGRADPGTPMARLRVTGVSPVYETEPIGASGAVVDDQPPYLNCAIAIDAFVPPLELRAITADIEKEMGRGRHARWEPRIIDIDLVLYGTETIDTPRLTVPHPRMLERTFVLQPLVDLDPSLATPDGQRLSEALLRVTRQGCREHTTAARFSRLIDGAR
jgi:2-amino-4-hydroxy-6-hydroxymethyldihydropteridine diphosphokinase